MLSGSGRHTNRGPISGLHQGEPMLRTLSVSLFAITLANQAVAGVPVALCGSGGCEYLVNNFSGTYPDERERVHWECFDRSTLASVSCSFVRGNDIRKYSDVYRKRSGSQHSCFEQCWAENQPGSVCAMRCRANGGM
jgi:hypothetical protein